MSRIGRLPIELPKGVEVKFQDGSISVKGPKGLLTRQMASGLKAEIKDGHIILTRENEENRTKSLHGLYRVLIRNMIDGVTKGFEKRLMLSGVGYRGAMQGKKLTLQLGFSHPVEFDPPEGVAFKVEGSQVVVSGMDKELVGQCAADIRASKVVEPYKAKGIKYDNEHVRRKAGKAAKAAGAAAAK